MTTPILGIAEVLQSQSNKEVTINDAFRAIENATQKVRSAVATAPTTLSDANYTGYFFHRYTGTPGAWTLNLPATERALYIDNQTDGIATVQVTGGGGVSVDVAIGEGRLLFSDGTDIVEIGGGGASDYSHFVATFLEGDGADENAEIIYVFTRAVVFPDDFDGSEASADTVAASGSVVIDVQKNGVSVGSITFAISTATATFTTSGGEVAFAIGDRLSFVCPAAFDSLAGIAITMAGAAVDASDPGALIASAVANTPAGNIAATDVQAAIDELDTEKAGLAQSNTFTASPQIVKSSTSSSAMQVISDGYAANFILRRNDNTANPGNYFQDKARGSAAVPLVVQDIDGASATTARAHDGTQFVTIATQVVQVREPTPGPTAMGARWVMSLTPLGSVTNTEIMRADHAGGLQMFGANTIIDVNRVARMKAYGGDWHTNTPVDGFSLTVNSYVSGLLLTPAGTLATGTITMSSTPVDGQEFVIKSTQEITALTHNGNTGQTVESPLTTIAAGGYARYKYRGSSPTSGTWYRIG